MDNVDGNLDPPQGTPDFASLIKLHAACAKSGFSWTVRYNESSCHWTVQLIPANGRHWMAADNAPTLERAIATCLEHLAAGDRL